MWQSTFEGSVNSSRPFQAIRALEDALTPALLILQDIVEANVQITLRLLNEDRNRWRPHIKTTKMASVIRLLIDSGIGCFKCSTTRELLVLCECNANDVLLAYPARGATAVRASEIAAEHTGVSCAALIDDEAALDLWQGKRIDLFVDLNPGMDRTGVPLKDHERIAKLVAAIRRRSLTFRGLHCYEGHLTQQIQSERITAAHNVYDQLLAVVDALNSHGIDIEEVITSGTPGFPCALDYGGFTGAHFVHRVSPGTLVYCDLTSLSQLPASLGYAPAAFVASRVVSRPSDSVITCDAGHKTLSVDRGVPNCEVVGYPDMIPLTPSEEHLPLDVSKCRIVPQIGEILYLLPQHVCPTVNNFDYSIVIKGERSRIELVLARGHEAPWTETKFTKC